jgi:hypothetical protein
MHPEKLNTVIIEVWEKDGNPVGGNTANIEGSNFKLGIISSVRTVRVKRSPEKQLYSRTIATNCLGDRN